MGKNRPTLSALAARLRHPSLKYVMVGALCACLNVLIQSGATLIFKSHYVTANLVSFVVLVPVSYLLHKKITFRCTTGLPPSRFLIYSAQWLSMLLLNLALLAILVDVLGIQIGVAILLATLILHIVGFLISRAFVFKAPRHSA